MKKLSCFLIFFCMLCFFGSAKLVLAATPNENTASQINVRTSVFSGTNLEKLFNWAENTYPEFFPNHQTTQTSGPWTFRFYPASPSGPLYVGEKENEIYVLGGSWGTDSPTFIDTVANLSTQISENAHPTGRMVRIDVDVPETIDIVNGTIQILSASTGYDSGQQPLFFGPIFYNWDTSNLTPANDYQVTVSLNGANDEVLTDNRLIITLAANPPLINKLVSTVDLSKPSRGLPVQFVRTYLLDSTFNGPLGYGWTHNYRMRILETQTSVIDEASGDLQKVSGLVQLFNADGTSTYFQPNFDGSYQSPQGDFRTLIKAPNGVYTLTGKFGTRFHFSGNGKPFRIEDRNGNAVTLQYDAADTLTAVVDASGLATTFTYNTKGQITAITDPVGRAVTYVYDAADNLVEVTDIDGTVTVYTYDAQHNLTTVTDPLGNRTFFTIDNEDRLLSVSGEGGANKQIFQYATPTANQMTVTDALGNVTIITYNNNALVTRVEDALGNASIFTYDAALNLASTTDANGNQTLFSYDTRGNLVSNTDAAGNTTTLTYDVDFNQVTSLTDARGNTTSFSYDSNGNRIETTYPNGAKETFVYDQFNNLTSKTDRKKQTIAYTYNNVGQLLSKEFPDNTSDNFTYDANGNLLTSTDENGTIGFTYDSKNRIIEVIYPNGESVSYQYDAAGNRSQLAYPNGLTLDYNYDSLNRLTAIQSGSEAIATYSYDQLGRTIRRALLNGTFTTYSHDPAGQLLELTNRKSNEEIISSFAYTYDSLGNRASMTTLQGQTTYIYDTISQLISVTKPNGTLTNYDLDAAGNRVSVIDNSSLIGYTTNELNQYTNVGSDSYTYDANGNLSSKTNSSGTTTYSYDFENLLVRVVTPTQIVNYTYDPFKRRISKSTSSGTKNYIHDELQVIMEKDKVGNVASMYVYGAGVDEVLIMRRGSVNYFYSHDGLGSITELTNSGENIVESYSYDSYGRPSKSSSIGNPYLFTGRDYDLTTELFYFRARYYDPAIGRFISPDPIGIHSGTNLYNYVRSNPISHIDPSGLMAITIAWQRPSRCKPNIAGCADRHQDPRTGVRWAEIYVDPKFRRRLEAWTHEFIHARRFIMGWDTNDPLIEEAVADTQMWFPSWQQFTKQFLNNQFAGLGGDSDRDGTPDDRDTDDDNDGIPDHLDPNPKDPTNPSCINNANSQVCAPDPTFIQSGNNSDLGRHFKPINPKTSLFAEINIPYKDSLIRADVPIFGLAYGENFKEYRVEYGQGKNPTEWKAILYSSTPVSRSVSAKDLDASLNLTIRGNLATWDTGLTNYVYLPSHPKNHPVDLNGPYTLRLVVNGTDGSKVEDRVTVHVTNVIPNAFGGTVRSSDNNVTLSVPEQAIRDVFRLISIQPEKTKKNLTTSEAEIVGKVYRVREPGERFSKEAILRMAISSDQVEETPIAKLGIYGYNAKEKAWESVTSYRYDGEDAIYAKVRKLHAYYAVMMSPNSEQWAAVTEPELDQSKAPLIKVADDDDPYLVSNTFETDLGEWSNRDNEVGGQVELNDTATSDGSKALKITNTNAGGNFAVNAVTTPFDAQEYPIVQFDYRIPDGVKTNLLARVAGRWYEIGFTDDPNSLQHNRVNIAHIGRISDVKADDQWHTASFNLHDMLRTRTGNTQVEQLIMADWDVTGYMLLQYGQNEKDATYYIDNFTIGRDSAAGSRLMEDTLLIDNFNNKMATHLFGGYWERFTSSIDVSIKREFSRRMLDKRGYSLQLDYDLSVAGGYAGYFTQLPNLDLRQYQRLAFIMKTKSHNQDMYIGLKDHNGREHKVRASQFVSGNMAKGWKQVSIPLAVFSKDLDRSKIVGLTIAFEEHLHGAGTVWIDDLTVTRDLGNILVNDFEAPSQQNRLGQTHQTFASGAAAINGQHTHGSTNGIYRLSFGGNIGAINAYASELKSFAGWSTGLGGIDCSRCEALTLRVRGVEGGENFTVYLDDGNFRWGVEIAAIEAIDNTWKTVTIPLTEFADYGVDLTHLATLQIVFEGVAMSGTVYLDDIRLETGTSPTDTSLVNDASPARH